MLSSCINPGAEGSTTYGTIIFHAVDQEDDPVPDVRISIDFDAPPTPIVDSTDTTGSLQISREAGTWPLTIEPPPGFLLDPDLRSAHVAIRRQKTTEYLIRVEDETPEGP